MLNHRLHAGAEFGDNFLLAHLQKHLEILKAAVPRDVLDLPEGPTVPIQLRQLGSTEGVTYDGVSWLPANISRPFYKNQALAHVDTLARTIKTLNKDIKRTGGETP